MAEKQVFFPPKTPGILLHLFFLALLLGGITLLLIMTFSRQAGWLSVAFLLGALIMVALLPVAAYRGYALLHAAYTIERDGLRVRWGLRSEDLPLTEVIWVRLASDLVTPLKMPLFSTPGAILGSSEHPELGKAEFIASDAGKLVIISAFNKTLILSPDEAEEFVHRFQRFIEMGSLSPIDPHSAIPAVFVSQVFKDRLARIFVPLGIGLSLLVLLLTSLVIPFHPSISLGYDPYLLPLPPVPSSRLLLLPVINLLFNFVDLITGFYFFRRTETRIIALFTWADGILTSTIFLAAILMILLLS